MKIAVATLGLGVSPVLDYCDGFMCYTVDRGIITDSRNMPNLGFSITQIIEVFKELDIDTLICGAIIEDVAKLFCESGVEVVAGCSGPSTENVEKYLSQTLIGDDNWDDDDDAPYLACCV